jgi:hypothetical protein
VTFLLNALADKWKQQGALGFAADARDLAIGAGVVGIYSLALAGAAIAGVVVAIPVALVECVGEMAEWRERGR